MCALLAPCSAWAEDMCAVRAEAEAVVNRVICADPPWGFQDALPGASRGAVKNYPTMSVEQICRFPLPPLADDAVLFLWRVAAMVDEALEVVRAWGFKSKSELVWVKQTVHGKPHFGMGRSVRLGHETCIIAHRGRPTRLSASVRSVFYAKVGRHSEKPEEFFDIVEQLYKGPYIELFSRRYRRGWTCVGRPD